MGNKSGRDAGGELKAGKDVSGGGGGGALLVECQVMNHHPFNPSQIPKA